MNNPFVTALKLGIIFSCLTGCASQTESQEPSGNEATAQSEQAITINMNCQKPIYGLPTPVCKPDLVFGQIWTEVWAPGNAANMAPGRYIHFGFKNDSDKLTGPFDVQIKDGSGAVLKTMHIHGLEPHGYTSVVEVAPYACGWTRVAVLDSSNAVDEYSESDNSYSMANPCPRPVAFPGTIQP